MRTDRRYAGSFAFTSSGKLKTASDGAAGSTQVSVSGYSTTVNVSSIGGVLGVRPSDTNWASSGGFHFTSSGELQISGGAAGSTQVSVSGYSTNVSVSGYSTIVTVSGGAVTVSPAAGSTFSVRPVQSSAADLRVTIYQSSAAELKNQSWTLDGITGAGVESSTKAQAISTMRGLSVRSITPDSTFASGVAGTSGDVALLTSAATQLYVYGINLGWSGIVTTNTKQVVRVQGGTTGAEMCRACFQISNVGADEAAPVCLAVSPPAYLGRTAAGASLNLNATSSGAVYSVFAWRE